MMGDGVGALAFWLAMGALFVGVSFGPIGSAIGRTVETVVGRLFGGGDRRREEELEQLSQRVAELQGVEQRVLELEERLDFAERLLSDGRTKPSA
jgi:hypothetical protein